jgi:hypothetical protein
LPFHDFGIADSVMNLVLALLLSSHAMHGFTLSLY